MTREQAFNVVSLLQKDPFYYRNFGVWWWHVKRQLKRNGFDQPQLQHLGGFTDPSVEPYYTGRSVRDLDREAFSYQHEHAFSDYNSPNAMTPDGEIYLVQDQDAE